MSLESIPVLLITANVGSIFEDPNNMLKVWTDEFLSTISRLDPKFIALHCQEVGGKNYEQSMRHVADFISLLMDSEELKLFDKARIFLDEDFSSAENFTALGNLYFIHESIKDVQIFDFKESTFIPVTGKEIHSGNIESIATKEKAKFPQDFFPECKWSRKGFLRTRWNIAGTTFDLINIHLFHDASNFIAMESFPSVYSKTRRRALEYTLDRFHTDNYSNAPYFLFGDCNFRTDTCGVIKKLTADATENKQAHKGNTSKLQFRNEDNDLILSLGKKEFSHFDHQQVFNGKWLQEFDRELEDFKDRLYEFPINFVPSYPFQEDVNDGTSYMKTRVPAWCDRVLLSPTAKLLVKDISSSDTVKYGIIGETICMGDHKPVYLRLDLKTDSGTISCCGPGRPCKLRIPPPSSQSQHRQFWSTSPANPNLLHANLPRPEPYTPDSVDTPSPGAPPGEGASACEPALLKSRLESIVDATRDNNDDHQQTRYSSTEDLGWQRRELLTPAWLQGETTKGYNSFCGIQQNSNVAGGNLLVPRIAVFDASTAGSETHRSQETSAGKIKTRSCNNVQERYQKSCSDKQGTCGKCCAII